MMYDRVSRVKKSKSVIHAITVVRYARTHRPRDIVILNLPNKYYYFGCLLYCRQMRTKLHVQYRLITPEVKTDLKQLKCDSQMSVRHTFSGDIIPFSVQKTVVQTAWHHCLLFMQNKIFSIGVCASQHK